ncbi:MAG: UvrD-helicase domain-containing protein [Deltaproteobacteria bacterium]|jgi:DNA helicase-2/ATP-dependent DNA helicase PcrA|nr:UvrD-helicase domain-containing protein [Deltaproteobacteria bacterium]
MLRSLNPQQRAAVEATEGPLLVLAGAGSGKTRVLTHRIAYLVGVCGIPPENILAVTFTNKAAGEMRERVEKILGMSTADLWISTFHSACVRILRRDISHLGYSRGFVIYDEGDTRSAIRDALKRHGLDSSVSEAKRYQWRIDRWKNDGLDPAAAARSVEDLDSETAAQIYATYQCLLVDSNALDFGDLLLRTTELFERFPDVLAHYQRRWQYVLIDEYQDTNRVQYDFVQQVSRQHQNLCVVGDPDQSIYAWRGADIRNIMEFERDYPDVKTVKLEVNYRSTQPILDGASGVVANNIDRRHKDLVTEREGGDLIQVHYARNDRDEADYVVRRILAAVREGDRRGGEFAIFYRTNHQSRLFEEELLKYDLPYIVVGGVRFYDRAEIKDALAYLRLLINPADVASLRRIINKPARGIGKTTIERAEALAAERSVSLFDAVALIAEGEGGGRVPPKLRSFLALIRSLQDEVAAWSPADALAAVLDQTSYAAHLEREDTPEADARLENLRELLTAAEDFERVNASASDDDRSALERFLDQVALVSDLDAYQERDDCVSMMTVHSAKGLEFPVVFMVGMEEGIFPHAASSRDDSGIEEERRLCYVGMTRAMEELTLTCAAERRRFGSRTASPPSRFLNEIPNAALAETARTSFDEGPEPDYSYDQSVSDEGASISIGLRVRHPVFGLGTVAGVIGSGPGQKLRIQFDRAGLKTVMLRYANLELG